MKTIAMALVSLVLVSGCSSQGDSQPAFSGQDTDEVFVNLLKDEMPADFAAIPDDTLIEAGHAVCDGFDAGLSFEDEVLALVDGGMSYEASGALIGASTGAYCPEHGDKIQVGGAA